MFCKHFNCDRTHCSFPRFGHCPHKFNYWVTLRTPTGLYRGIWPLYVPHIDRTLRALLNGGYNVSLERIEVMSLVEENKSEEEPKPVLKLIRGGKGPPTEENEDWLSPLPVGLNFLVKKKKEDFECLECHILHKSRLAIVLVLTYNKAQAELWVEPKAFCKHHTLIEILEVNELI